jgi:oxygen-independent coproporphyrinogen-3 oxidase
MKSLALRGQRPIATDPEGFTVRHRHFTANSAASGLRLSLVASLFDQYDSSMSAQPFSLYVHIPYCVSKCPYCDFNSHVVAEIPEKSYVQAVIKELTYYEPWHGRPIQSIFFGGGTPSTFQPESIGMLLENIAAHFPVLSNCEVTLEANPGTVDRRNFHGYRAAGVNRISLGVQSFNARLLKFLGRVHSVDDAVQAIEIVNAAGFENFSLDLIYANPGQTLNDLENDLDTALGFRSPHLSAYNLTIEEGTPFHNEFRKGKIRPLTEEEEMAMAELIERRLREAGLQRYEISNYARPGFQSRHNVNYWQSGDYLGLGAGAHSYQCGDRDGVYGYRWWNEKLPARYMSKIETTGNAVAEQEQTDLTKAAGEFMFSGLRLVEGICLNAFAARFGRSPLDLYPQISSWLGEGWMETDGDRLQLTRRGLMVANSLFVHFV